mmetsp:Transcript_67958/g.187937  ORF Transcript_67958/g.187937 Transcript_67958/m.187937 type:complete len:234 (-) Transcript_67958:188-889(-)
MLSHHARRHRHDDRRVLELARARAILADPELAVVGAAPGVDLARVRQRDRVVRAAVDRCNPASVEGGHGHENLAVVLAADAELPVVIEAARVDRLVALGRDQHDVVRACAEALHQRGARAAIEHGSLRREVLAQDKRVVVLGVGARLHRAHRSRELSRLADAPGAHRPVLEQRRVGRGAADDLADARVAEAVDLHRLVLLPLDLAGAVRVKPLLPLLVLVASPAIHLAVQRHC